MLGRLDRQTGKDLAALGILVLTASVCMAQLLIHLGLPVAHDMVFHVFQADQFNRGLGGGAVLPRWVLSSGNGYGSPNFIFYAPLSYYLVALLHLIVPSSIISIILAIWISFFLSGATMLLAVKRISGEEGSLLPAMLYQFLPFHLLNLYGRGAFAELCAYAWFPLIILFMYETLSVKDVRLAPVFLSISYAGLILTHLVSAFMFTFVSMVYLSYNYIDCKCVKASLYATFSLVTGLGIASFYLLPAIFERKLVQLNYVFNYIFSDYRNNFLFMADNFSAPFYITLQAAVFLEIILFVAVALLLFRNNREQLQRSHNIAMSIIFVAAFLLATPLSAPLWGILPVFTTLQFPWRWVSVMELSLCFLAGAAFSRINLHHPQVMARMALYSIAALFLASLILIIKNDSVHSTQFLNMILDEEQVRHYTNLPKEYTPIWATDVEKLITGDNTEKVSTLSGRADYHIVEWQPERRVIGVSALTPALVRISTFYYPGWKAELDGKKSDIAIENKTGAMLVNVPRGDHALKLIFGDTSLRVFSRYVSYGSCVVLAIFALFSIKKRIEAHTDH